MDTSVRRLPHFFWRSLHGQRRANVSDRDRTGKKRGTFALIGTTIAVRLDMFALVFGREVRQRTD